MARVKLSDEERRERKRASLKAYYARNKTKIVSQVTARAQKKKLENPELVRAKQREYTQKYRKENGEREAELRRARLRERCETDQEFLERKRRLCRESYYRHQERRRAEKRENHAANREKNNARRLEHYYANREENRPVRARKAHQSRCDTPLPFLWRSAKDRAARKGVPFDLTKEYLSTIWLGHCAVTGMPFRTGEGFGPKFFSPSLDRIEREKGYVEGNVRFVIWAVNVMKYDGTDDDLLAVAQAIVDNKKSLFITKP